MVQGMIQKLTGVDSAESLREYQQHSEDEEMHLRRALIAAPQAATAAQYLFYQMPKVDKAWCPYCIVDALTLFATFGLTLKESTRSVRSLIAHRASPTWSLTRVAPCHVACLSDPH
jgi:hypothetical protein